MLVNVHPLQTFFSSVGYKFKGIVYRRKKNVKREKSEGMYLVKRENQNKPHEAKRLFIWIKYYSL